MTYSPKTRREAAMLCSAMAVYPRQDWLSVADALPSTRRSRRLAQIAWDGAAREHPYRAIEGTFSAAFEGARLLWAEAEAMLLEGWSS